MVRILVAEDDASLNKIVCGHLNANGYEAIGVPNGRAALEKIEAAHFDMLISDIMMPEMDGFTLAEAVRAADKSMPLLFLTAREDIASKQRGYGLGIDEYIVKPFDLDELLLRVRAVLRRARIRSDRKLVVGNLVMDSDEHSAYVDGEDLALTVREFNILYGLLSYPKKTFTRAQLMEQFWDYDSSATSRTVDVYMVKLREKTAHCTGFEIVTVYGLGYKAVLR